MKTAILKIEVPDDFEKGNKACAHAIDYCYGNKSKVIIGTDCTFNGKECNAENCPLEIKEEPQVHYCCECKHGTEGNMSEYCYKNCHNRGGAYGFEPKEIDQ